MGKEGLNKPRANSNIGPKSSMTLREDLSGKKKANINAKSMAKLEHIRDLAMWAGGEGSAYSLSAFFGHQLAALGETLGSQPDSSLFLCEKCESILQPGQNCTVRIEHNTAKTKRRRKNPNNSPQNHVVYNCHFCSHRNLKRGTPRHHLKTICPPKPKQVPKPKTPNSTKLNRTTMGNVEIKPTDEISSVADVPTSPLVKTGMTLLEVKSKKRTRSNKKKVDPSGRETTKVEEEKYVGTSNKRKRKSWTSLKELAQSSENDGSRKFVNLTIPFVM